MFALYGLYDYILVQNSREVKTALNATINALISYLPKYNAGFWSFYDLKGNLASPFYHRLHIAQLKALEVTFPQHALLFFKTKIAFEKQLMSRQNYLKL
ncbi:MAG: D-glucuronyl C5-epimerase family protein [Bacillus sp. (in: Bacteria)]|nr:D-glucuronyl C5-epimerase family protein [Bacillus sp. (in: firmicutes)]